MRHAEKSDRAHSEGAALTTAQYAEKIRKYATT
jgi:hypothetical protein